MGKPERAAFSAKGGLCWSGKPKAGLQRPALDSWASAGAARGRRQTSLSKTKPDCGGLAEKSHVHQSLALWSYLIPLHLFCKVHFKSLAFNTALEECYNKSDNKTDHGKSGDKRTKHFEMKLVAERSLRSCSDALRSNPSPFLLAGL